MSKARILIVDDSVVMRRLISTVLGQNPEVEVAGFAANGKIALSLIAQNRPDLITLDVEMPEMDGLTTLTEIRRLYPAIPVIMFSTLTHRGAVQTIDALARGATDYVAKPANVGSVQDSIERLQNELIPKILALTSPTKFARSEAAPFLRPSPRAAKTASSSSPKFSVVAIASSTGGPNALLTVLSGLPKDFPVPILIVQHMPPLFTALLAKRLNEACAIEVVEAEHGQPFKAGCVYIAPGGKHMEARLVDGRAVAHLHDDLPENSCRPAADVLFRSVAQIWPDSALCVVLTGMGQDGMRGARAIRERGGYVMAQDRESSVVWGMPGAVTEARLADDVLPLREIATAMTAKVKKEPAHALIH